MLQAFKAVMKCQELNFRFHHPPINLLNYIVHERVLKKFFTIVLFTFTLMLLLGAI